MAEDFAEIEKIPDLLTEKAKEIRFALGLESVLIITTAYDHDEENSNMICGGNGSMQGMCGAAREWLLLNEERIREHARRTTYSDDKDE